MKKIKIALLIAVLCVSVGMFCYGVLAAAKVTFKIEGDVAYEVQDVYVNVETTLYKTNNRYNITQQNELLTLLGEPSNLSSAISTYTLTQSGSKSSFSTVKTESPGSMSYSLNFDENTAMYVFVINVKNLTSNNAWAVVDKILVNDSLDISSTNLEIFDNYQLKIAKDSVGKNLVILVSPKDVTTPIPSGTTFSFDIICGSRTKKEDGTVSYEYVDSKTNTDKIIITNNDDDKKSVTKASDDISGVLVIPGDCVINDGSSKSGQFYNTKTSHVILNNGVTSVGKHAFFQCKVLKSITIPSSLTSIGDNAFYNCSGLTSLTIPSSVTSIGSSAFRDCSVLNCVTIESGSQLTSIGQYAFQYCSSLTSITIPSGVTSIGQYAFQYCSSLTSITIPSNITSIGEGAFYACSGLESISVSGTGGKYIVQGNCLINTNTKTLELGCKTSIIPTDGSVTSIGNHAFRGSGITSITIPSNVASIGNYVFRECSSLTSITIPSSVTSIGIYAFHGCSGLTSITIPSSVTSIQNGTFYGCSGLTNIKIPSNVTSIGSSAFRECSSLTNITIPSSVTSIGGSAFYECTSLQSITIPSSVTSIGDSTFWECSSLTSITIPSGVTSIGSYAFRGCSSLTSITIPSGVKNIKSDAFDYCYALAEVYNLSTLSITAGNSSNGYVGYYAKIIHTNASEPTRIIKDETNKFYYYVYDTDYILLKCYDKTITDVTLNSRCTSINQYAFQNCSNLTSVTIPSSVTSIGHWAFSGCSSLTTINFTGTQAQWNAISGLSSAKIPTGVKVVCTDGTIVK